MLHFQQVYALLREKSGIYGAEGFADAEHGSLTPDVMPSQVTPQPFAHFFLAHMPPLPIYGTLLKSTFVEAQPDVIGNPFRLEHAEPSPFSDSSVQ